MKPRLHFHSDAAFFAGCENMLVNFFADPGLAAAYEVSFSYRGSAAYEQGLRERVPAPPPPGALPLWDVTDLTEAPPPGPLRRAAKALGNLLLLRHWLFLRDAWTLWRVFGRLRPDVLHVNNGGWPGAYSCHAAVVAARLRGARAVVYVVNNLAVPYRSPRRWLDWPLDRLVACLVDAFVVANAEASARLEAVLGARPRRIPNGVAPRAVVEDAAAVRRRLGVPEGRTLAVSVALLIPRKGHAHLLAALARLKGEGRPVPFLVIEGEGESRPDLEAAARRLGLEGDVRFAGREPRVQELMSAADLFIETSVADTPSPNVVVEAMMLGRAVLASSRSSADQVSDGVDGLLVDPADEPALAGAVGRLASDAALRAALGAKARAAWERDFSPQAAVAAYAALYRELLQE